MRCDLYCLGGTIGTMTVLRGGISVFSYLGQLFRLSHSAKGRMLRCMQSMCCGWREERNLEMMFFSLGEWGGGGQWNLYGPLVFTLGE